MTIAASIGPAASPPPRPAGNALLSGAILPTLVRLSVPNVIAMVATALVAVAETAYVGVLGIPALAGLALVFPMIMLQQMMSAGAMGGGISSAISRALGAGNEARAKALVLHAVIIGTVLGLAFTTLFLTSGAGIYRLLGGSGAILEQALSYSNVAFIGALGTWLTNTMASVLRGTGNMKLPSTTLLLVAAGQIILGGSLGLGLGPLPRLGMPGIALGQVIAFGAGACFLFWYLMSGRARIRLSFSGIPLQWEIFRDIFKVGALACLSPLQTVATVLVLTRLVTSFGTEALAGYGIGARLEFLLVPITFAIGVACVPMVGMAIGAGQVARARQVAWTGAALSAGVIGSIGILVAIFPDAWTGLFTNAPDVLASAALYFKWAGPCYGLFGVGLCLYFASQGSGKMLGPVLAGTVRLAVVALGGWWLAVSQAPVWSLFALVGLAMATYGVATAFAVYVVSWEPKRA